MKKDTFGYKTRLFYERWKWYFVNAYFMIGIAIVVLIFILAGNSGRDVEKAANDDVLNESAIEAVQPSVNEQEQQIVEQENDSEQTEEKKEDTQKDSKQIKSYVLINKYAVADRVSASLLMLAFDAQLVESEKEVDDKTVESIFQNAKEDTINLFVVGGSYVISEDSFARF